ncbi:MAG: patatin-like phospholipase family protein [Deltaproteobacteria bacterium]|nr:patatin-like phospholipase family protein [Deltaproteobacteria bacterium]MBW1952015.1 patatin-like phospholipase family protein [Deltaproteobacteria bacterium]MBW1986079.1 patatin-like phospholipase family protein [Deltaproteobacteria bacterium]MBW2134235.1 patatin-like phospholipase family protein [Deltaproteobacteria bacterium]
MDPENKFRTLEPRMNTVNNRLGLALGAGGAKGLCHIAFLKVLDEMGVKPHVIAGTSIGAIIGSFYAAGLSGTELEEELRKIGLKDLSKVALDFSLFNYSAILKGKWLEEFLKLALPVQTFEELQIPLKVVATDFWKRKEVVFDSGDLIGAVRASSAMPFVFEPVVLEGAVLIDGGAVNPLPYDLVQSECEFTIAIDASGTKDQPNGLVPNMLENVLSTFQIMQASIVAAKMKAGPPDLYAKSGLRNIRSLDFYRYKEILSGVEEDVHQFREKLKQYLMFL